MKEKISLEASGMPGVIKTMEKHFGKLIEKASRITEPQSEAKVPTSVIDAETKFPVPVLAESKDVASQCGVSADHYQNDDEARESTQISSVGYKAPATDSRGGKTSSAFVGAPDKWRDNFFVEGYEKDGKLTVTKIGTPEPISNEGEWTHVAITKKREPEMYSMMLCRDYLDDEFEVLVEILDYHSKEQGGCWDEVLGPTIEMGDAFTLQGKQIELTELELERAAEGALEMIESTGRK